MLPRPGSDRSGGRSAGARVWLLPNPSGLNAHYQLADLAAEYRTFRLALDDC